MLNSRGHVAEGTADNVFIVQGNTLLTPPVSDGALTGRAGVDVHEQSLALYDIYTAEACFLTGTGAELIPVARIDGRRLRYCPHPLFDMLQSDYRRMIEHACRAETP